eukprot:SAG11_NODE_15076_length_590_cov_0.741344_2_plen_53_part_00
MQWPAERCSAPSERAECGGARQQLQQLDSGGATRRATAGLCRYALINVVPEL